MVVERYPVHDGCCGLAMGAEFLAFKAGQFKTCPKAFYWRIIPTVAFSAHGCTDLQRSQSFLKLMTAILAAPVAMEDQPRGGPSAQARHHQGILDQLSLHVRLEAPTYDLTAK